MWSLGTGFFDLMFSRFIHVESVFVLHSFCIYTYMLYIYIYVCMQRVFEHLDKHTSLLALAPPQSPAHTEGKGRGEDFTPHLGQALQTWGIRAGQGLPGK